MLENDEKYTSQFPKARGDVFRLRVFVVFFFAPNTKYVQFISTRHKEKQKIQTVEELETGNSLKITKTFVIVAALQDSFNLFYRKQSTLEKALCENEYCERYIN